MEYFVGSTCCNTACGSGVTFFTSMMLADDTAVAAAAVPPTACTIVLDAGPALDFFPTTMGVGVTVVGPAVTSVACGGGAVV